MTRDDIETIVDHIFWNISPLQILEDENIQASKKEIEDFISKLSEFLDSTIEEGVFDE